MKITSNLANRLVVLQERFNLATLFGRELLVSNGSGMI